MLSLNNTAKNKGGVSMLDKSKEKTFAERQDSYKQEKEEIFKKALEEYHEKPFGETIENDQENV
ncbi:hypothetical protein RV12_GL001341 [Enterococcus quebecensis]|nr:hypothetical protein RV12_GL001341 [Enterococcus quebecensis]